MPYALLFLLFAFYLSLGCSGAKNKQTSYEFTGIRRGNIERTVSSSGTINPVSAVKVLPRMSGKVEEVLVDYNDSVRAGDILARLNTDMLRLQRDQQLANVQKARSNYELQLINYQTQQILAERNLISEYELKTSRTNLNNYAIDLSVAENNLKRIDTEINQYAYITSPIDGIVLDRNINVGDTVVDSSSNNSTSIFTIAENLREMQIEATVGELDVTSIHKGQDVRFTLESLPGRRFSGVVETLRMVPVVQSNVVSYTVIINVENQDGSLLPGMTCAVDFIVESVRNSLMVPNAALRFQPTSLSAEEIQNMVFNAGLANMTEEQQKAALEARESARSSGVQNQNTSSGFTDIMMGSQSNQRMPGAGGGRSARAQAGQQERRERVPAVVMRNLWFINGEGKLEVIQVRAGVSDGQNTQVFLDDGFEGMQIILREQVTGNR